LAHTSNVDILGVFDELGNALNPRGPVFLNQMGELQFYIRAISDVPETYGTEQFTVFTSRIQNYFIDDPSLSLVERQRRVEEFIRDKVLVFNVEVQRKRGQTYHIATNIRIHSKSEGFRPNSTFIPVPVFSTKEHGHSFEEFKGLLLERKPVGRIDNIATGRDDTPQLILWRHDDDLLEVIGEFRGHLYVYGGYQLEPEKDTLRRYGPFKPDWLEDAYDAEGTVLFVPREAYQGLVRALKSDEAEEVTVEETVASPNPIAVPMVKSESTSNEAETTAAGKEIEFLKHFQDVTLSMGLQYSPADLCNFHVSMKASTLTILAGLSGTGKSKLVQAYAKALGRQHELVFIPVRPSWSDDADLLGYADLMHMIYRPADSGLVNVLIKAAKNQNKFFIVCFDEMNLARVEHYFSQLLSVLENEPGERRLRLYNPDLENRLYNGANYPPEIEIGDNVLFVGTVNLDESTYHFSDKVLDRANVIQLDVLPFGQLAHLEPKPIPELDWPGELYSGFRRFDEAYSLTPDELDFLWAMHETMQKATKSIGVGPRTVRQIDLYIKNIPVGAPLTRADALDRLVCQRILTKLRGPEELLSDLIRHDDQKEKQGGLLRVIEDFSHLSHFSRTKEVLKAKWREVQTNGYTI
jgi:energy-coupling factor transporter ATP-binding protein EcfA2